MSQKSANTTIATAVHKKWHGNREFLEKWWTIFTKSRRNRLRRRWGETNGCCEYCGKTTWLLEDHKPGTQKPPKCDMATYDHILPRGKGGGEHPSNMVLACYRCNHLRGDSYTYLQFKKIAINPEVVNGIIRAQKSKAIKKLERARGIDAPLKPGGVERAFWIAFTGLIDPNYKLLMDQVLQMALDSCATIDGKLQQIQKNKEEKYMAV